MLGIIGAMDVEVNSIKSELENVEIKNNCPQWTFTKAPLPEGSSSCKMWCRQG